MDHLTTQVKMQGVDCVAYIILSSLSFPFPPCDPVIHNRWLKLIGMIQRLDVIRQREKEQALR